MLTQTVGAGKRLSAHRARIIALTRMSPQMHLKIKSLIIQFSIFKNKIKYFEVCRAGETLVALIALVRSLTGVRPFMLKQLPSSGKLFTAVAACIL